MPTPYSYSIFFDFIESYLPSGFLKIDPDDPIMLKLEELTDENDQYFQVFDVGQMKFLFTSKRIFQMIGVTAEEINPGHYTRHIHPDDEERLGQARARVYKMEKAIFQAQKGSVLTSYNLRIRNAEGNYIEVFVQDYMFYSPIPHKAVFLIQVITNIDGYKMKKDRFHLYVGNDLSLFRFPDQALLEIGPGLSYREFEIIRSANFSRLPISRSSSSSLSAIISICSLLFSTTGFFWPKGVKTMKPLIFVRCIRSKVSLA
ncbi:MAG: hypothetical protein H6Q23_871 [Bacteroidetes bacterium]|nr:hypothetical protein [Bacteroidota bacterium]